MIRLKLIALALCLVIASVLMAQASGTTDAYFSDTKAGAITATLGRWARPCTLEVGTSKARHWDLGRQSPKLMTIAFFDIDGQMRLDFGDEPPGNCNSSPDVFRIVSHDTEARVVTLRVHGALTMMVGRVQMEGGVLEAGATARVSMQLSIPHGVSPGVYTGELIVSLDGSDEARIPMTLTVRPPGHRPRPDHEPTHHPEVTPEPAPATTPSVAPSPTPSADATATPVSTPVSTPAPTPIGTPTGTPQALGSG